MWSTEGGDGRGGEVLVACWVSISHQTLNWLGDSLQNQITLIDLIITAQAHIYIHKPFLMGKKGNIIFFILLGRYSDINIGIIKSILTVETQSRSALFLNLR